MYTSVLFMFTALCIPQDVPVVFLASTRYRGFPPHRSFSLSEATLSEQGGEHLAAAIKNWEIRWKANNLICKQRHPTA